MALRVLNHLIQKIDTDDDKKTAEYDLPNALQDFDSILPNKNDLLLFLDYDGTLSEIVSDPDKAVLTESMEKLLTTVAALDRVNVIITTGRSIEKVRSFIANDKNIHFAGNHGIEIEFANKANQQLFVSEKSVNLLKSAYKELSDEYKVCEKYNGTQIEYKKYSMSLHYRNMKVKDETKAVEDMAQMMKALSEKYQIHLSEGKCLFELKCVGDWNKGYAIKWMLDNRQKVFELKSDANNVIFIGDDVTDEDGFDALLNFKNSGNEKDTVSSILVTHHKVRPTKAGYIVDTVRDVEAFLNKILDALK